MLRYLLIILLLVLHSIAFAEDTTENVFSMTTTAFLDKNILPVLYTCDGKDISPQLEWTNPPANTKTFAIILTDSTVPGFYHWVLYNIPSTTTSFPEGMQKPPASTIVGKNSWKKAQYNGPCPPKGTSHSYVFTLYALDTTLSLPANADGESVLAVIPNHILGKVELTGVYSRWIK